MQISIIINNYNYGSYLRAAIESAVSQTYSEKEVIVVDDGSTDDSREIIRSFGNKVKPIFKANGGQASAFNAGFLVSRGECVIFLDSDDMLEPQALAQAAKAFRCEHSKIQFPLKLINSSGNEVGGLHPDKPLAQGDLLNELVRNGSYCTAPTSGNLFSRRFLTKVLPMPEQPWVSHADCYLIHLAPFFGPIGAVSEALGKYRLHSTTLSLSGRILNGQVALQRVRNDITRDQRQRDLIAAFAEPRGLSMPSETLLNNYCHYKLRLTSIKLDAARHPFPEDNLLNVTRVFVKKTWGEHRLSVRTRLSLTAWAALMWLLPPGTCRKIAVQGLSPQHRLPLLNRLRKIREAPARVRQTANTATIS